MNNIIDELGAVNQAIAELETTARKLKAEIIARGVGKYEGAKYFADVQSYERATISPTLVRKLSNEDFVASVTEVKTIQSVTVKHLEA